MSIDWRARVLDPTLPYNSSDLTVTVRGIFEDRAAERPIDFHFLEPGNEEQELKINPVHLAVALRTTWDWNAPRWRYALLLAIERCEAEGLLVDDVLYGLLNVSID